MGDASRYWPGRACGSVKGSKTEDFSDDCSVLHVRRSIWGMQEQAPKPLTFVRVVDLPDSLARLIRDHVLGKSGYLFGTKAGKALSQRNAHTALHESGVKVGFHAFRRFRTETLRRADVPQDLINLWLGHSKKTLTDFYAGGLDKDQARRCEWCQRAGLGFSLVGPYRPENVVQIDSVKVA